MTAKKIALFGMFRSGTNYTRTLLEWNYKCELVTDVYPWKHGFFPIIVERSQFDYPPNDIIFVTKDPFSSISSLFKYYSTNGRNIIAQKDWKVFLRERFVIYDSFQEGSPQYRFANVVEFWNSMNWNLSSVGNSSLTSLHVCYRDLLANPLGESKTIAQKLKLDPKFTNTNEFKTPENITKNMGDKARKADRDYTTQRPFDATNYEKKKYLDHFDKEDRKFVLKHLDIDLTIKLGYKSELVTVRKSI